MWIERLLPYVSTICTIVAILVAGWSAHEAHVANKKAEEANKISKQALELQKQQVPPSWSEIIRASKDACLLENRSGKDAIITQIQAVPARAADLMIAKDLPKFVAYGDNYLFLLSRPMGGGVKSIKIKWYYKDEPETEHEALRNVN